MSTASPNSKPQNRLKTTGHTVFGFADQLALAQFTLGGGSISPDLPAHEKSEEDLRRRLTSGLVKHHETTLSADIYLPPLDQKGHTVTIHFSEMIDALMPLAGPLPSGDAETESEAELILCAEDNSRTCRLTRGRTTGTSHYSRYERVWVVDYFLSEPAALSILVRYQGWELTVPLPSPQMQKIISGIRELYADDTMNHLRLQTTPEHVTEQEKALKASGVNEEEEKELTALLVGARQLLELRADYLKSSILALWQGGRPATSPQDMSDWTLKPLNATVTQDDIDVLSDALTAASWLADGSQMEQWLRDAQTRLLKETLATPGHEVRADNHVVVTFSGTPARDYRLYRYYLLWNGDCRSELLNGENTTHSAFEVDENGQTRWTVSLTPALTDTWSLEVRRETGREGMPYEAYVLHQSDSNVFFESADTRQALEARISELFEDAGNNTFDTLKIGTVLKDIETLRGELDNKNFDTEFTALMSVHLNKAQMLLDAELEEMKKEIDSLPTDIRASGTSAGLSLSSLQARIDRLDVILKSKNPENPLTPPFPYDVPGEALIKAQQLLLDSMVAHLETDDFNHVAITFNAKDGSAAKKYDYDLMLGQKILSQIINTGKKNTEVIGSTLRGNVWNTDTIAGPGDRYEVRARKNGRTYALNNAAGMFTYASRQDQTELESGLRALLNAGQTALKSTVTQSEINERERQLTAMALSDAQRKKLTALLDRVMPLWLKSTLFGVVVSDLNQVVVTFNVEGGRDYRQNDYYLMLNGQYCSEIKKGRTGSSSQNTVARTWTTATTAGPKDTFHIEVRRTVRGIKQTDILYGPTKSGVFSTPAAEQNALESSITALSAGGKLSKDATQEKLNALRMKLADMKLSPARRDDLKAQFNEVQMLMLKAAIKFEVTGDRVTVTFVRDDSRLFSAYYCHALVNGTQKEEFRYLTSTSQDTPQAPKVYEVSASETFLFKAHLADTAYILFTVRITPDRLIYPV